MKHPIAWATYFFACLLLLPSTKSITQSIPDHQAISNLDLYYKALEEQQKFQGVILIAQRENVIFNKAYGLADIKSGLPNYTHYSFRIGSITKSFTAILIAQAIESNLLNLETSVHEYLPEFPRGNEIMLRHLLSHTSGIVNYFALPNFDYQKEYRPIELIDYVKELPLQFDPGEGWDYSNTNYAILGYILEVIYQKPYRDILQSQIFEPLGMHHSGVWEEDVDHKATGHGVNSEGDLDHLSPIHHSASYAAGNIIANATDLLTFSNAFQSELLISNETKKIFTTPIKNNYGMGFVKHHNHQHSYIGHNGGNDGFHANWKYFPDLELTVIILCNNYAANFGKIVGTTANILLGESFEMPVSFSPITLPKAMMQSYEGDFFVTKDMTFHLRLKEDGFLYFQATGQDAFRILPYEKDGFFLKNTEVSILFGRDEEGQISHLLWNQGGSSDRFDKIAKQSEN